MIISCFNLSVKLFKLIIPPPPQEPKLSAARRIVTEWSDYDEEMQRLAQDIAKDRAEDRTLAQDKAQPVTKDEL